MKKLILCCCILLRCCHSFGLCLDSWEIYVWPRSKEIPANPIFVISASMSEQIVTELNRNYRIYLSSGNDTVPLSVVELFEGDYKSGQRIVKPIRLLKVGENYRLHIDSLPDYVKEEFLNSNFNWTVTAADHKNPKWMREPTFRNKGAITMICGFSEDVNFCTCTEDDSPVMVYTQIKNLSTGLTTSYYVESDSCILRIGGIYCNGPFSFGKGEKFEATFSLVDAGGNTSGGETEPVLFSSPGETPFYLEECDCLGSKSSNNYLLWTVLASFLALGLALEDYWFERRIRVKKAA